MLLTCILGLTWLFGVFYINQDSLFMAYCFTIFNTLQVTCYHQLLFIVLQSLLTPVKLLSCSYQSKTVQPSETPSLLTQLTIPHWKIIYFQDWKYQTTLPNMKYYLSITCVQSVSVKRRHLSLSYFFYFRVYLYFYSTALETRRWVSSCLSFNCFLSSLSAFQYFKI